MLDDWMAKAHHFRMKGDSKQSFLNFSKVLLHDPQHNEALFYIALNYFKAQHEKAAIFFNHLLSLNSYDFFAHHYTALLYERQGLLVEALIAYKKALILYPQFSDSFVSLSCHYYSQGDLPSAKRAIQRALFVKDKVSVTHKNQGIILLGQAFYHQARDSLKKALLLDPSDQEVLTFLGNALHASHQLKYAEIISQRSLTLDPQDKLSQVVYASILLALGDFSRGWQALDLHDNQGLLPLGPPVWKGDSCVGKKILLHGTSNRIGLGDYIHFGRYCALVKERGWHLSLEIPFELHRLFETIPSIDELVPIGTDKTGYDRHCPLMRLPFIFETHEETIPPPLDFHPPPERVAYWKEFFSEIRRQNPSLKAIIGIVWAGNHFPHYPRNSPMVLMDQQRSIPPEIFNELGPFNRLFFISLQKDKTSGLPTFLKNDPHHDLNAKAPDLAETAAMILALDLVITVDTSILHLAASLGIETWLLNRYFSCWRWQVETDSSPWYPSLKIFNQIEPREWKPVIRQLKQALMAKFDTYDDP
jgi:tetratricopeptide (TPR) repeat protein